MITKDQITSAVKALGPSAHTRKILNYLEETLHTRIPIITVYNQLDALESEGVVVPKLGPRGENHQRKIFYELNQ